MNKVSQMNALWVVCGFINVAIFKTTTRPVLNNQEREKREDYKGREMRPEIGANKRASLQL